MTFVPPNHEPIYVSDKMHGVLRGHQKGLKAALGSRYRVMLLDQPVTIKIDTNTVFFVYIIACFPWSPYPDSCIRVENALGLANSRQSMNLESLCLFRVSHQSPVQSSSLIKFLDQDKNIAFFIRILFQIIAIHA